MSSPFDSGQEAHHLYCAMGGVGYCFPHILLFRRDPRPPPRRQPEELVLPYVVERKRLDDLAQSIRGTRYHEQKHRLSRCGLPHVIYLAEALGTGPRAQHLG